MISDDTVLLRSHINIFVKDNIFKYIEIIVDYFNCGGDPHNIILQPKEKDLCRKFVD
jgi:hypothetical protein